MKVVSVLCFSPRGPNAIRRQAIRGVDELLVKGMFRRVDGSKVVTTVQPATDYYIAEDYHQQVRCRMSARERAGCGWVVVVGGSEGAGFGAAMDG